MELEIRACRPEEFGRFLTTCEAAFGEAASNESIERHRHVIEAERCFAAWDGDSMVGTGGNYSFDLTIPGGSLPAAGVTMVGVLPTHRRRGLLTRIMAELRDDALARNEPLAVLWASETVIYQRFGYGLATKQGNIEADRDRLVWLDKPPARAAARMVTEEDALKVFPEIYDRVCARTPGMFARSADWWRYHRIPDPEEHRDGAGPMYRVVFELDGKAEGYAMYRIHGDWDVTPKGRLRVIEALGTTPEATREVWRFLFGVDLIQTVYGWWLPMDHPLLFMVAEPPRLRMRMVNFLWLRILDIERSLAARSYAASDSVVIGIEDEWMPANQGQWRLDTGGDAVAVTRTDDAADLQLSSADLACIYLGGSTVHQLLGAGRGKELKEGAATRVDAMFRTDSAPFCPEIF
ncbi:MAG: hypothetical protein QOH90_666 [Actinomycetota bacterium]|nr:hypothetical protein [Actinomycetota bacterium]